jgi:predicted amidophosphoribosyltransferase
VTPSERTQRWRENNREKYLEGRRHGYQLRRKRGVCNECGRPSKGLAVCRECLRKRKPEGGAK